MAITVISENGTPTAVFRQSTDAEEYEADLKKRYPRESIESVELQEGRPRGHEALVWAASGVYEVLTGTLHLFQRGWHFQGEMTDMQALRKLVRTKGEKVPQMLPLTLVLTNEPDFLKAVKAVFHGTSFNKPLSITERHLEVA